MKTSQAPTRRSPRRLEEAASSAACRLAREAAGRAVSCQPGTTGRGLAALALPDEPQHGTLGLPDWGGGRRCRRRGVPRVRGSAVHRPADRCAGSSSQAARHCCSGRGQPVRAGRAPSRGLRGLAARQETARATQAPGPPAYRVRFHLRSRLPARGRRELRR